MAEKQMDQSQARRRRRDGSSGVQQRLCTHCGRSFKRSEHLERHVRTHTKEKPYVCHCGSAYSRRDLLTRHQRITHETLSPRSPDAPASEDNHQLAATDSDPPSEDTASTSTAPMSDMSMNHGLQQHQYSTSHDYGIHSHPATQPYHQLIAGQELDYNGQHFSSFDHYQEVHNFADGAGLPPEWTHYLEPNLEDTMDPALRGSMVDISSPLSNESFSAHAYNPWMSQAAQKWGN
ncbi:uncharacterized protein GGS22DRAFT_136943 [Annulohypoxylon maeteangense]|uniref:uncharacterized protein n=1 Tax=Annulohypoxylon maeteangense TaxID=1927788 RepID=UPI00200865C0|nr:uncharacterized protein GGS22DRAFT_136943 [Annulohypoxylon maeteangense]KAI0884988.1 hypothetical protein GGS22DRAFT_136943 [Annulohypoxylon maeteangense]